jgi:hypothetical protein
MQKRTKRLYCYVCAYTLSPYCNSMSSICECAGEWKSMIRLQVRRQVGQAQVFRLFCDGVSTYILHAKENSQAITVSYDIKVLWRKRSCLSQSRNTKPFGISIMEDSCLKGGSKRSRSASLHHQNKHHQYLGGEQSKRKWQSAPSQGKVCNWELPNRCQWEHHEQAKRGS